MNFFAKIPLKKTRVLHNARKFAQYSQKIHCSCDDLKHPIFTYPKPPPKTKKFASLKTLKAFSSILFAAKSEGTCCHSLFHHGKEIFRTSASQSSSQSQRQKTLEATQYRPGVLYTYMHKYKNIKSLGYYMIIIFVSPLYLYAQI